MILKGFVEGLTVFVIQRDQQERTMASSALRNRDRYLLRKFTALLQKQIVEGKNPFAVLLFLFLFLEKLPNGVYARFLC